MAESQLDTPAVASERAAATTRWSNAVRNGDVERVNYGGRTVEVGKIDHAALGRPVDRQYERNRASVETRLASVGVMTATVVNFLPIPLISDSCLDSMKPTKAKIMPARDGDEYSTFVFNEVEIVPSRMGVDSPNIAVDIHPIQMAQEFSTIHPKGVMSFIGIPSDLTREDWKNRISPEQQHGGQTYGQVLEQTRQAAIAWMQEKIRGGNDDDRRKIPPSESAKASARRLKHLGLIKEFPAWVEKQRDVSVKIPMCPKCQRPCEISAVQCTNINCDYILDPRRAYEIDAIGEDHLALERLTREEVQEMGISDYVAETRDEKIVRMKAGAAKPLSVNAQRVQEANEEMRALDNKVQADNIAKAIEKTSKKKES